MNILIAEDDVTSRIILKAVLEKAGYDIVECENGIKAWDLMQKTDSPDIAVIDWLMPEMDGVELVERIRELNKRITPYVIMVTSKNCAEDIAVGLDKGANDYLVKPFDNNELIARLHVGERMIALQKKLALQVEELKEAMNHIKVLQGIIPICSFCKKIRNDEGYWNQLEDYISRHSEALFSHGLCPECYEEHYGEYIRKLREEKKE